MKTFVKSHMRGGVKVRAYERGSNGPKKTQLSPVIVNGKYRMRSFTNQVTRNLHRKGRLNDSPMVYGFLHPQTANYRLSLARFGNFSKSHDRYGAHIKRNK